MSVSHLFLACILLLIAGTVSINGQRPSGDSICKYYANALNLTQELTVKAIVVRAIVGKSDSNPAVTGLINEDLTKGFFNGEKQYRIGSPTDGLPDQVAKGVTPNFAGDVPVGVQGWLMDHLVGFFGKALGCDAASYPQYTSIGSMRDIHKNMPITPAIFNAFNAQIGNSAASFGVTAADVAVVGGVLNSFGRNYNTDGTFTENVICNDPSCPCAQANTANAPQCNLAPVPVDPNNPVIVSPGYNSAHVVSVSFILLITMALSVLAFTARL